MTGIESKCQACGHINGEGVKFCSECGQKLSTIVVITLDRGIYRDGDQITAKVSGITAEMHTDRAFLAVYKAGAGHRGWGSYQYPAVGESQLTFTDHLDGGNYEMRLYRRDGQYDDTTLVTKVLFTIERGSDDAIIIELDKSSYAPTAQITVTAKNISNIMQQDKAFIAIYKAGAEHTEWGEYRYPTTGNSQMTLPAPADAGAYEMRLYRRNGQYDDASFVKSTTFVVGIVSQANPLVCPACKKVNPAGTKFCFDCGTKLATIQNCPACGTVLVPEMRFCGNCGYKLG